MEALPFNPSATAHSARPDHDLVAQIVQSDLYREYQKAFEITTGLPLTIREVGSFQPPWHGTRRKTSFCALMSSQNKTCSACLQIQQRIEADTRADTQSFECFAGLTDSAVPIRMGDRVIAFLQTGQILMGQPTAAQFRRAEKQLAAMGATFDSAALRKAFFETRVVTRALYESVLRLLAIFAQHLAVMSNELMVRQSLQENPAITRARQYIAEHHHEEISLKTVAQSVHMSRFYFCKIFKDSTGLTFVEYLARVRVETVKHLLLNPHKRMSEAAYEAGFQSLSQFNRVFREIAGQSPSAYSEKVRHSTSLGHRLGAAA